MSRILLFIFGFSFLIPVFADSPLPYKQHAEIIRGFYLKGLDYDAKKKISDVYEASVEKCSPDPGASFIILVTEKFEEKDPQIAEAEIQLIREKFVGLGFDKDLIYSQVLDPGTVTPSLASKIFVELSCRKK